MTCSKDTTLMVPISVCVCDYLKLRIAMASYESYYFFTNES